MKFDNPTIRKKRSRIWNRQRVVDTLRRIVNNMTRREYRLVVYFPEGVVENVPLEIINEAIMKGLRSVPEIGYRNKCASELFDCETECKSGVAS